MDELEITIHYERGIGYRPSAVGKTSDGRSIGYCGEYRATPEEALAHARKALAVYDLLEKVS
jgi:hypothetical protein